MKQIIIVVALLCAAKAAPDYETPYLRALALRDDGVSTSSDPSGQSNCTTQGPNCESCTQLSYCLPNPSGTGFDNIILGQCAVNETCRNGSCTSAPNLACSANKQITCNDIGMFPDPSDCQWFHVCTRRGEQSVPQPCEGNYYYDAVSTYCKLAYPTSGCPANTRINCTKLGERGAYIPNKTIYYFCVSVNGVLTPSLRLCPNGRIFSNDRCA